MAYSVSSLPRPTFSPGWCFVPRCRTSIVPAFTSCPPKRFTPSLCPWESRPFVDEPPPFLCAITQSSSLKNFRRPPNLNPRFENSLLTYNYRLQLAELASCFGAHL